MSSYSRGYAKGYRPKRQDIKTRTMDRIIALDEDVASRYEYDDEDPVARHQPSRSAPRVTIHMTGPARNLIPFQSRRDIQNLRAGPLSSKRDLVFQMTVKGAARTGFDSVLRSINSSVENFKPIAPNITPDGDLEFFLTDSDTADAVKSMSRRIVDKKNPRDKLTILQKKLPATWDRLSKEVKDVIQSVVHSRFQRDINSLDLTEFGTDKKFLDASLNCALFRNEIMVYVADLIDQHYNFITGLSLKGNRLRSLNFASTLVFRAPKVKELDLSNNGLTRIEEVEKLKGWPIEKLHLENNELCKKYGNDASTYTRFFSLPLIAPV